MATLPHLLNPALWRYKNEGNANIVLQYIGDHPDYVHHVLRLRKGDGSPSAMRDADPAATEQEVFDLKYARAIVAPLIGAEYVGPVVSPFPSKSFTSLLEVTPMFLKSVSDAIQPHRPPRRLTKSINVEQRRAILSLDYTRLPSYYGQTLSIELKCITIPSDEISDTVVTLLFTSTQPKWGFLPTAPNIHPAKRRACRFCMHQFLKHEEAGSGAHNISGYCPLDLFSGKDARMRRALEELMKCPQNNFKMWWKNGEIEIGDMAYVTALLDFFAEDSHSANESALSDLLVRIFQTEPLLTRLKRLQCTLDSLDIEGIRALFTRLEEENGGVREPEMEEWKEVVRRYGKRITEGMDSE
ncbi:LOW QUALITY PROTEIN: inositol-pentakisphosphate 2-kinase [Endogone sp. FLAS-F59071]|nr:LOW QUALITY PROTEIN: inositol-pentakisphosphate 2-kinase [Endogone sp. FLAS-F59071]|eukprot:RUS20594.1 LOW QUALITY PROTEIN: inositol-pentakisphosphate 2-kinase [Endogone sp. FLAS-F59071]